jgi:hypothetical protein
MTKFFFISTQLLLIPADNCTEDQTVYYLVNQGENGVFLLRVRYCVLTGCLLLAAATSVQAGVFESIHPVTAQPVRWLNPQEIPYYIDEGSLGQLNRQQASDLVEAMMAVWENEGGGAFHFVNKGSIGADVTTGNMKAYVDTSVCADNISPKILSMIQGQSPIIFDSDGSIIDALSGPGASRKIVGKAAFRCFKGTLADPKGVTQAFLILNGRFIDALPDPIDLPINVYAGVILHELGHYIGLHHSMVNEEIYAGVLNGTQSAEDSKYVPVMYPLILPNSVASTVLKPDDVAILRELYPAPGETLAKVSGTVLGFDGSQVPSANVVARRTDDPLCQAVSGVSGRECTPMISSNNEPSVLSENCGNPKAVGDYVVRGLTPGQYTMEVSEIVDQGGARQNMFPKGAGQDLPGEPMLRPELLTLSNAELGKIEFRLQQVASVHQTSIDTSVFLKTENSDCKPDPVDYKELVSIADTPMADSSSSLQPPAAMTSSAGCSLHVQDKAVPVSVAPMMMLAGLMLSGAVALRRSATVSRQ